MILDETIMAKEGKMADTNVKKAGRWKRFFYSDLMLGLSDARQLAYIAVLTALCIAVNFFEIKFGDVQFSFTVFASILTGMILGPVYGFVAVFLGDAIGFLVNSGGFLYMPWVGLSVAMMSFIAGCVMKLPMHFKGNVYLKLAIICLLTLFVCSVGINTTGMYFYYTRVGFSQKALGYIADHFGGVNLYWTYALVRLVFMGQLINSAVNYVLLFIAVPILGAVKPLRLRFE